MVNAFRVSQTGYYATMIERACDGTYPFTSRIFRVDSGSFAPVGSTSATSSGGKFTVKSGVKLASDTYFFGAALEDCTASGGVVYASWNDGTCYAEIDATAAEAGFTRVYVNGNLVARCGGRVNGTPDVDDVGAGLTVSPDWVVVGDAYIPAPAPASTRTHFALELSSTRSGASVKSVVLRRLPGSITPVNQGAFIDDSAILTKLTISGGPPADADWPGNGTYDMYFARNFGTHFWHSRQPYGDAAVSVKGIDGVQFSLVDRTGGFSVQFNEDSTHAAQTIDGGSFSMGFHEVFPGTAGTAIWTTG